MSYVMFLDGVQMPVTPSKIKIKIENKNKTIDLIDGSEINSLKPAGLTEVSFDLLLPNFKYHFANYEGLFKNAYYYLGLLERLKTEKRYFPFSLSRNLPNGDYFMGNDETNIEASQLSMNVSLESYTIEEDAKEGFDITVSVTLKQYKECTPKKIDIDLASETATVTSDRVSTNEPPKEYVVKSGDTLYKIAKTLYGDGSLWTNLYVANEKTIEDTAISHGKKSSNNGSYLYVGTVLTVPEATSPAKLPSRTNKHTTASTSTYSDDAYARRRTNGDARYLKNIKISELYGSKSVLVTIEGSEYGEIVDSIVDIYQVIVTVKVKNGGKIQKVSINNEFSNRAVGCREISTDTYWVTANMSILPDNSKLKIYCSR